MHGTTLAAFVALLVILINAGSTRAWCVNGRGCENNGRCINSNGTHVCVCPAGYEGTYCQRLSNATCEDTMNRTECMRRWDHGWCAEDHGQFHVMFDECRMTCQFCSRGTGPAPWCLNSCYNGGICVLKNGNHVCKCPLGYEGSHCQTRNTLDLSPVCRLDCYNGGGCHHSTSSGRIFCQCNTEIFDISDLRICRLPCQNGGYCKRDFSGSMYCRCPQDFVGVHCETRVPRPYCGTDRCPYGGNVCRRHGGYIACHCRMV